MSQKKPPDLTAEGLDKTENRGNGFYSLGANLEACKTLNDHILTHCGDLLSEDFLDGLVRILDVGLLEKAVLAKVFVELTFNDLLDCLSGLTLSLAFSNLTLCVKKRRVDLFAGYANGASRSNVHRDVTNELLEIVSLGNEVGFTVDFAKHTDLTTEMDVGVNETFRRLATGLFGSLGYAALAEKLDSIVEITFGFDQRFFTIHKASTCAFTQLADLLCSNLNAHF